MLHIQQSAKLDIFVTAGDAKRPLANQAVLVRKEHPYQFIMDEKESTALTARDRYVYTDENGKATTVVEAGKDVQISVYAPES
ncbi:MAG: hypothetical protein KDB22_29930 [Planctomycetales bacterium]|nr:hypothetical protein [Planctomycetales bacterium]